VTPGAASTRDARPGLDLLAVPLLGRLLRWRHARAVFQVPLLLLAIVLVVHGLTGPQQAPKNLATVLTWVHYRGLLVLGLLVAGNVFCMACPFMLVRDLARRVARPVRGWPTALRNKWTGIALLVGVLYAYELFDLWGDPSATAWLIVGYFGVALLVDSLFTGAWFCKSVCPIGQFNFAASSVSPLEVTIKDRATCDACPTNDCLVGRKDPDDGRVVQRGCELGLFLPRKAGNMDCTLCLDCVHACPVDNVAISPRLPASELFEDPDRSGVGRYSRRTDLAVLAVVFTFGALLNAFGMVSPVYAAEQWLAGVLGTTREAPVLGILFLALLVVEPVLLLLGAAWVTRRALAAPRTAAPGLAAPGAGPHDARAARPALLRVVTTWAWTLVPLGVGVWMAHYGFHLLTGLWTFVPVAQKALVDAGLPLLGQPRWGVGGLRGPVVQVIEMWLLALGLLGSLITVSRVAVREQPAHPARAGWPWAAIAVLLFASAVWLLNQPMEMRGTVLGPA
jgi:ferredoxin